MASVFHEFIGTLPYRSNETPMEFESRCINWLRDLLRDSPHGVPPNPERSATALYKVAASLAGEFRD